MTEDQLDLLIKAKESYAAAKLLLSEGFHGFAASRAYYTMFYVAQAFLEGEEMAFSKHSAVIAAFGQHFAHTGRVPTEFHRYLRDAMDARHEGDYATRTRISEQQAAEHLQRAEKFLELAERIIGPIPPPEHAEQA